MNKPRILSIFLLLGLILSPTKEDDCMAGLFKKKYVENQSGQNLPVATVPGKIVFQSNRGGTLSEILVLENGRIRKIASDERTTANLPKGLPAMFGSALASMGTPKWSPDGSEILRESDNGEIIVLDADGQILKKIKPQKSAYRLDWNPVGNGAYFTAEDNDPKGGGSFNIYHVDFETNEEHRLTNLSPLPGTRRILSLAVSPDGKRIAFTCAGLPNVDGISIWLVNSDGSDLKLLVKYASDPAWSPDGIKLAYSATHLDGKRITKYDEIFILDLPSMQTRQITHNNWNDRHSVFSPDGKQIAYKSARHVDIADGAELFVINIDGTGEARLTPPQRNPQYPPDSLNGWATDEYPDWHA